MASDWRGKANAWLKSPACKVRLGESAFFVFFNLFPQEFKISERYKVSKEVMDNLWKIEAGEAKDAMFVKTAAVNIFGSDTLAEIGVVKGITRKGVKKEGLDRTAPEAIQGEFFVHERI